MCKKTEKEINLECVNEVMKNLQLIIPDNNVIEVHDYIRIINQLLHWKYELEKQVNAIKIKKYSGGQNA